MGMDFSDEFFLKVMKGDSLVGSSRYRYQVKAYEISRIPVKIELPKVPGSYEIVAELHGRKDKLVRSYRKIKLLQ
jgi:hypothetical protein